MSRLYGDNHRQLQEQFETRRMADAIEHVALETEVVGEHKGFIESRDMFFLSTVDHNGRPTVSHKGGDPGFVKVVDDTTVVFPSYDGNGMFLSMGNIKGNKNIGMLFIDFQNPHRLRLQGEATIHDDDPALDLYKEADLIVKVKVSEIFVNCPRYVHKYQKVDPSKYVPRTECDTPLAGWKHIDMIQEVLPPRDQGRAEKEGGIITMEEWYENVAQGDG